MSTNVTEAIINDWRWNRIRNENSDADDRTTVLAFKYCFLSTVFAGILWLNQE